MKHLNFILPVIAFIAFIDVAWGQTIPEKYFTKTDSPVFLTSGFVNFSAAWRNQATSFEQKKLSDGFTANNFNNPQALENDAQIFLKAGFKRPNDDKYGVIAKFEYNINTDGRRENPNLDQAFIFSENFFGKFEFGNNTSVNQKMKYGPSRFVRGAGGINGKYLENINLPMLADSAQSSSPICNGTVGSASCSNVKLPRFILLAQSPIGHGGYAKSFYRRGADNNYALGDNDYSAFSRSQFRALKDDSFEGVEDATKINYYSPRLAGFQLGLSYAPDSANNGFTANTARDVDLIRIENIFSFGLNYVQNFDNLGLAIALTGEKGKTNNSKSSAGTQREDLAAYDISATLDYFGFSFGASYGSWGKSLQPKSGIYSCDYDVSQNLSSQNCRSDEKGFSNPYYYTAGIAYEFGPIGASFTGLRSEFQRNIYQSVSLGFDYKLTKSLMPYFEVTKFAFKSNQPKAADISNQDAIASNQRQIKDNQGYVFLAGILLSF